MSIDLEFRVVVAHLLILRLCLWLFIRPFLRNLVSAEAIRSEQLSHAAAWMFSLVPLIVFVVAPSPDTTIPIDLPDVVRWMAILPIGVAFVWVFWALHHASGPDEEVTFQHAIGQTFRTWPYRVAWHAVEYGDCVLVLSLALLTEQLLAVLGAVLHVVLIVMVVLPQRHRRIAELLAPASRLPPIQKGFFFSPLSTAQYQVPRRFGIVAVMGMMTILCLIFGGLNALRAFEAIPMYVDLFIAAQFLVICFAQMVFGKTPRAISAIAGAIILPLVACATLVLAGRRVHTDEILFGTLCPILPGAFLGYCFGALAAGFFLFADYLEFWLTRKKRP